MLANASVDVFVLFLDQPRFGFQTRQDTAGVGFGVGNPEHPADGPAQVDGGGPGGGDVGAGWRSAADEVVSLAGLQLSGGSTMA